MFAGPSSDPDAVSIPMERGKAHIVHDAGGLRRHHSALHVGQQAIGEAIDNRRRDDVLAAVPASASIAPWPAGGRMPTPGRPLAALRASRFISTSASSPG
ncbi:hypothetical protein [Burkholderia sp. LMG 32019]|uniref:hypothetical protein n=1 Tax=Burkholderia sp. LMG 32019 TaxID=3158173 RepID=UPI003C2C4AC8